jgi:hypothetical protein
MLTVRQHRAIERRLFKSSQQGLRERVKRGYLIDLADAKRTSDGLYILGRDYFDANRTKTSYCDTSIAQLIESIGLRAEQRVGALESGGQRREEIPRRNVGLVQMRRNATPTRSTFRLRHSGATSHSRCCTNSLQQGKPEHADR